MLFPPPEAASHPQETAALEENEENVQDATSKSNKKDVFSYGENKAGPSTVFIHVQKSLRKYLENLQI